MLKKKFILFIIYINIIVIIFDLFHLVSKAHLVITLESVLCFSILFILVKGIFIDMHLKRGLIFSSTFKKIYLLCKNLYLIMLNFYKVFLKNLRIVLKILVMFLIKVIKFYSILFVKFNYFYKNIIKYVVNFNNKFLLTNFL